MRYDETTNEWKNISPHVGDAPAPRFGHSMICHYNFLVIFGGQGEGGHIFGDLWVYDIIRQDWI
jgi:Galactose oxidase, central domain